jgi:hypothetical protein
MNRFGRLAQGRLLLTLLLAMLCASLPAMGQQPAVAEPSPAIPDPPKPADPKPADPKPPEQKLADPQVSDQQAVDPQSELTEPVPSDAPPNTANAPIDKRIFGVLPNYRTANASSVYEPISQGRKMYIGLKDSFDYPFFFIGGIFATIGQITNENPSFGQGVAGYTRRYGTSWADQVIGNMMTESFFPIMLHEDPRYFRLGSGPKWHRAGYALTRVFVTRTDSGGTRFNFSEVLGNGAAAAISNLYYPDGRNWQDNVQHWGTQIGTDALSQLLKEFWPDIKHKFFKKHTTPQLPLGVGE